MPFGPEGLAVTWVGPIPKDASVTYTDSSVFDTVNAVAGAEVPASFPQKYRKGLRRSKLFNATLSWSADDVVRTQKRFKIEMEPKPLQIFRDYIEQGNVIFSTLVTHPTVADASRFTKCDVVLQRAVLVSNPPVQTIYLRSYFHSAASGDEYVNFAPSGGLRISHESDTIWFPLRLTSVITEPASFVVLDILSADELDRDAIPRGFRVTTRGKVSLNGQSYALTRLRGVLSGKEDWPDIRIKAARK